MRKRLLNRIASGNYDGDEYREFWSEAFRLFPFIVPEGCLLDFDRPGANPPYGINSTFSDLLEPMIQLAISLTLDFPPARDLLLTGPSQGPRPMARYVSRVGHLEIRLCSPHDLLRGVGSFRDQ